MRWKSLESKDLVDFLLYFSAEPPRLPDPLVSRVRTPKTGMCLFPEPCVCEGGTMQQWVRCV